jgi:hypothetical protein
MDPITIAMGLAQAAPAIVKWISGSSKAEEVAVKVIDIAKDVTGMGSGQGALANIAGDPAVAMEFRKAVMANELEFDRLYLADRQDARARDVAIVQAGRYNWRADVLAFLAVGGLVLCVYFIARDAGLPERAVNAIMFVAGVLASAVRDVYGYEFGSSRSSQTKDQTIASLSGK